MIPSIRSGSTRCAQTDVAKFFGKKGAGHVGRHAGNTRPPWRWIHRLASRRRTAKHTDSPSGQQPIRQSHSGHARNPARMGIRERCPGSSPAGRHPCRLRSILLAGQCCRDRPFSLSRSRFARQSVQRRQCCLTACSRRGGSAFLSRSSRNSPSRSGPGGMLHCGTTDRIAGRGLVRVGRR